MGELEGPSVGESGGSESRGSRRKSCLFSVSNCAPPRDTKCDISSRPTEKRGEEAEEKLSEKGAKDEDEDENDGEDVAVERAQGKGGSRRRPV